MKSNKTIIWSLVALIIVGALYRVIPNRPYGFAPQIAMAVFAGLMIKDKKWVFAVPIFSMFFSDLLYELLYLRGLTDIRGFYEWQWVNYLLFMGITAIGTIFKRINVKNFLLCSFIAPTAFFLSSNFVTWITGYGYQRPSTFAGLMQCYADGLPFYGRSIVATLIFGVILFGAYFLFNKRAVASEVRL